MLNFLYQNKMFQIKKVFTLDLRDAKVFLSFSITHKKLRLYVILKLRNYGSLAFFFPKYSFMNRLWMQIFCFVKYDLKGHWMSHRFIFYLNPLFLDIFFVCTLILSKFGMNANMIKTQRSFKFTFFKFCDIIFSNKSELQMEWKCGGRGECFV